MKDVIIAYGASVWISEKSPLKLLIEIIVGEFWVDLMIILCKGFEKNAFRPDRWCFCGFHPSVLFILNKDNVLYTAIQVFGDILNNNVNCSSTHPTFN